MAIRIAINGFGRIGRAAFKIAFEKKDITIVAINDLMPAETLAHLLKYDTVYGKYEKPVKVKKNALIVQKKIFPLFSERDPSQLPWGELGVDVVLECTGIFRDQKGASAHIRAGAKSVIISAPANDDEIGTVVFGTHATHSLLRRKSIPKILSNASCTTNCISPVIQVLESRFGVEKALMTTVHSYTAGQNLVDGPNRDLRRARAAAANIVPTTTGAARATTRVVKKLHNLFDGISLRVPTICVSLADITCLLKRRSVTPEEVNDVFIQSSREPQYRNILSVCRDPLVSSDFIQSPYSAIVDLAFTRVVGGNLVKVIAWYDNEWGYSNRLVEMAQEVGRLSLRKR